MSKIFPFTGGEGRKGGGGGGPLTKIFFSSLNMYQAKSGVKIFSLYQWGGPSKKIFSSLNMYQAKSGVKKFSLYWWGGKGGGRVPQQKIFFSSLNMYQAKSGVKIFSLYRWGGPSTKIFFSSLNMYQAKSGVKNFSLYQWWWGGGSLDKKFFCQSEHVSSQIWCQNFFPLPVVVVGEGGGCPSTKKFFASLNMYQAKSGVKIFSPYWWWWGGGGSLNKKFFFPV